MAHPEGEVAAARAAQAAGTVFILSTISTSSIEEVAEAAPEAIKWFQLYIYRDREVGSSFFLGLTASLLMRDLVQVTKSLVKRAETAGFSALVLTVDAPMFGRRLDDIRNRFSLPPHLNMANFAGMGDLANKAGEKEEGKSGINEYVASLFDQGRVTISNSRQLRYRVTFICYLLYRHCNGGT